MKRIFFIFTFLSCIFFYCNAQKKIDLYLEYSPHFSHLYDADRYTTFKFSHVLRLQAAIKITEQTSFVPAISYLNAGAINGSYYNLEKIGVNYGVLTIGTKFKPSNFYLLPEFGMAVFINQIETEFLDNNDVRRIRSYSLEIDYNDKVEKVSMLIGFTMGYEFEVFKKSFSVGVKSYLILADPNEDSNSELVYPHGIGLNFGIKL